MERQIGLKDTRIGQLEAILLQHGNGAVRQAVQSALSEQRMDTEAKIASVEKKIGDQDA